MILTRDRGHGDYEIHSYESGQFKINEEIYNESLLIGTHLLISWLPQNFKQLSLDDLTPLLQYHPDLILLGTGEELIFPDASLFHFFYSHNVGFEVMNTLAACRTFNVLVSERRNVIAALLIR